MTVLALDSKGNIIKSGDVQDTEYLLKLRETKPFWEVVEEVIKLWKKRNPSKWDSYIIHLKATKEDQKETSVGSKKWRGVSRQDGIERSLVVDFPVWIDMCLRVLYQGDGVEFNKDFYREFAKRFPLFRVRESV